MIRGHKKSDQTWGRGALSYLQFAGLFELGHVALPLERAASCKENILVVLVDVLDPVSEPGDCVVVNHLFPRPRSVRFGDGFVLADINCDVLRTDTFLGTRRSEEDAYRTRLERP